jgi:hypothetical protein
MVTITYTVDTWYPQGRQHGLQHAGGSASNWAQARERLMSALLLHNEGARPGASFVYEIRDTAPAAPGVDTSITQQERECGPPGVQVRFAPGEQLVLCGCMAFSPLLSDLTLLLQSMQVRLGRIAAARGDREASKARDARSSREYAEVRGRGEALEQLLVPRLRAIAWQLVDEEHRRQELTRLLALLTEHWLRGLWADRQRAQVAQGFVPGFDDWRADACRGQLEEELARLHLLLMLPGSPVVWLPGATGSAGGYLPAQEASFKAMGKKNATIELPPGVGKGRRVRSVVPATLRLPPAAVGLPCHVCLEKRASQYCPRCRLPLCEGDGVAGDVPDTGQHQVAYVLCAFCDTDVRVGR